MKIYEGFLVSIPLMLLGVFGAASTNDSREDPPYFTAAVFEHHRLGKWPENSLSEIVEMNLNIFARAAQTAKAKKVDIIVFPEYGIFPLLAREEMKSILETVPDPVEGNWNPCEQLFNDTMLFTLSCMAKTNDIVVVANMGDKQPCHQYAETGCPVDGVFLYNANVAFDRDGKILSRYRKEHLFFESAMNLPQKPQIPVFTTDFATLAMFVCFDSLFKPMAETAQIPAVDAVLLPTEWMDLRPQLSANLYWQAWATGNNISLLAANGQYPHQGSAGSGIFTANLGPLSYTFNPDGLSKLVVSRVPKIRYQGPPFPNPDASITIILPNGTRPFYEDGKDVPEFCLQRSRDGNVGEEFRCNQQVTTSFTLIKLTESTDFLQACNNGMCCSLYYSADLSNESYYFGLLNATHNVSGKYFFTEEMCFVFRCNDVDETACSVFPMVSDTVFRELELRANFTTKFVYPSVVHSRMRLAPRKSWDYTVQQETTGSFSGVVRYTGDGLNALLTAGLYGRSYDRDPSYVG